MEIKNRKNGKSDDDSYFATFLQYAKHEMNMNRLD